MNLILDDEAVPELIQESLSVSNLKHHIRSLVKNNQHIKNKYAMLKELLSTKDTASNNAADIIFKLAKK